MSGQHQTIWEILGIGPTMDKKRIRHAYAQKCRECHPEDHPEEFQLLRQAYKQALAYKDEEKEMESAPSPEVWDNLPENTPDGEEESANALSSEQWEELLENIPDGEEESASALSAEHWEELLARGMEDAVVFPSLPDPFSWQQIDRTQFSSAAITESDELLEQMKHLEDFCRNQPPQEEADWEHLMESWDLLADSRLFRKIGESPCYFQMLFGWLNEERGRLHISTIIGLLRIYQINRRIIGHPRKARRYERKIPALRRLTYEFIFYQSIWNTELFLEKFNRYKDRKRKNTVDKPKHIQKEENTTPKQRSEGGVFQWLSEHRLLWKLFCLALILLFRYIARIGG